MRIIKVYGSGGSFHAVQFKDKRHKRTYVKSEVYSLQGEKLHIPAEWVITSMHFLFFNDFYFYFKEWKDRVSDSNYENKINWHRLRRIREMR